jgi:hypothetical protein
VFNSAITPPNSIVTDLLNPYPANNYSVFEISVKKPAEASNFCWSVVDCSISYRLDSDTLRDGGYVEVSYDGGINWSNILSDTVSDGVYCEMYSVDDTLYNGTYGISGLNYSMLNTGGYFALGWSPDHAHDIDSCRFRFVFISDSIDNLRDGWLIDNIRITVADHCNIGIQDISKEDTDILIYPLPANYNSILEVKEFQNIKEFDLEVFDLTGKKVFQRVYKSKYIKIGSLGLRDGVYILKIKTDSGFNKKKKLIIKN